jgi:general secretion pathway protein J
LVRERALFTPLQPVPGGVQLPQFSDPVVLVRAPFRIRFSYAGVDRVWQDAWHDARQLPQAVRVTVKDATSDRTLLASTATRIHADIPADCVAAKTLKDCLDTPDQTPQPKPAPETQL